MIMSKRSYILIALTCLLVPGLINGQGNNFLLNVQALGGYTNKDIIPFWLRSNHYGSQPLSGASLSFIGAARKDYDLTGNKLFDWGASFEGRANLGDHSNLTLIEGYGKIRFSIFELRAGRSKQIMGLCDTILTSGSWSVSGTNLGIPQVGVSIPEFFALPWFDGLFAFKGQFSHGWLGEEIMKKGGRLGDTISVNTYLHQKSFYGRFGKPSWKFKLYGGFNHQVMWSNGQELYDEDYTLSIFNSYLYVITGKRYSYGDIQSERLGNHLGSIDIGFEYDFDAVKLLLYRQNFYETGALAYLGNIKDGLNGISLQRKTENTKSFSWDRLLFELLYTKSQGGDPWSTSSPSGSESYYNHGQFINGWSYDGAQLGTSLITTRSDARKGLPSNPSQHFVNNRLIAFHIGVEGSIKIINFKIKTTFSKNYGTYYTAVEYLTANIPDEDTYGIFGEQQQLSAYIELNRDFIQDLNLGFVAGFDYGDLFNNSFGVFCKASRNF